MERNILSQTTHKIMYYVIMWVYRLLQFINYILYKHTTINKNTDQVLCDYITLNYSIHREYTEDYVLWDYVGLEIIMLSKIYCVLTVLWKEIFCHRLHIRL